MAGRSRSWSSILALLIAFYTIIGPALMVKHENFKTCDQSGFCTRNRAYADEVEKQGSSWISPYTLDASSLSLKHGSLHGGIEKAIEEGKSVWLPFTITFLASGAARVTIDEQQRQTKGEVKLRHDSKANTQRYNEVAKWVITGGLETNKDAHLDKTQDGYTTVVYGKEKNQQAVIRHKPFAIDFKRDGVTHMKFNEKGYLNVEHWRAKVEKKVEEQKKEEKKEGEEAKKEGEDVNEDEDEDEPKQEALSGLDDSTWWEESFGGNQDTKPKGPESIGMDITFPDYEHVFGIPEHTGPMSLKQTRGGEGNYDQPYRLYNLDVFEYEMDSPMALYGAIPYMQAHRKDSTVGVFWMNAAETWIDIVKSKSTTNKMSMGISGHTDTQTHWFSESGLLDVVVLLGPTPQDNSEVYAGLTGFSQLPPMFSIAYHQCRWNYITDSDVRDVDRKFDKHKIPYDVIWLDLEYLDDRKYFTWEPMSFKDPIGMQKQLDEHGRKLVVLIDPHIKNQEGYPVSAEIKNKDLAVKTKDNELYEGWCWPGSSHWVDCFKPGAVDWWKSLHKYKKFTGSAPNLFIWNDMNEPSVFNGPETTMPKDNIHYGGWEHRDVHNLNGFTFINASYQALLDRDDVKRPIDKKRPFVLTRSFFAGSQRLGAMWTGDNQASWDHLAASLPMVMQNGVAGFPFAGADVGGFFGNPSKELLTRWYQAGTFYPFFRGHAHIDTRRREPYLAGEPYTSIITQALRLRYSLLPTWYTSFFTAHSMGLPIVRPNWYMFPSDEKGFGIEDQMYLADTGLLVKPVTSEGGESVDVYISDAVAYYDYFDYTVYSGSSGRTHTIQAPLEKLPLLMQSGHIISRKDRPRRSSALMKHDPYTLVVVLDQESALGGRHEGVVAHGELYIDDAETFAYTEGAYTHRWFKMSYDSKGMLMLSSEDLVKNEGKRTKEWRKGDINSVQIEKIIIVSPPSHTKGLKTLGVTVEDMGGIEGATQKERREVEWSFEEAKDGKASWGVIRSPGVKIGEGWRIAFE